MGYFIVVEKKYHECKSEDDVRNKIKTLSGPYKVYSCQKTKADYVNEEMKKGIVLSDSTILMNSYVIPNAIEVTEQFFKTDNT